MACSHGAYDVDRSMMLQESLLNDASQIKQLIRPNFSLSRVSFAGESTNLNFVLEGPWWFLKVVHVVLKNRMQERGEVLFSLFGFVFKCKSQDLGFSLVELMVACCSKSITHAVGCVSASSMAHTVCGLLGRAERLKKGPLCSE